MDKQRILLIFIPFFVWLNVDVTNDMDVCKFYPKFAQKEAILKKIQDRNASSLNI